MHIHGGRAGTDIEDGACAIFFDLSLE